MTVLWPSPHPSQGHDLEPKALSPTQEVYRNMQWTKHGTSEQWQLTKSAYISLSMTQNLGLDSIKYHIYDYIFRSHELKIFLKSPTVLMLASTKLTREPDLFKSKESLKKSKRMQSCFHQQSLTNRVYVFHKYMYSINFINHIYFSNFFFFYFGTKVFIMKCQLTH